MVPVPPASPETLHEENRRPVPAVAVMKALALLFILVAVFVQPPAVVQVKM